MGEDISSQNQPVLPKNPYRGIRPMRYADRNIFSARDWEKKQLINLVSLFRGSLLFGQSGIGKSSLINAGLIPVLIDYDYNPEVLRIAPSKSGTFIIYKVADNDQENTFLPSIFDKHDEGKEQISISFEVFRETVLSLNASENGSAATTVFIFDQFEELITLFEEVSGSTTDGGLDLDGRRKFQQELIEFFRECYYNNAIRIKFIFVFREDYLAKFSRLFAAIPDLRQQSLRIKGIPVADLKKIISFPFSHVNSHIYYDHPFTEQLTDALTDRFQSYFSEEVVLTDLQIVCQYLYETEPSKRMQLLKPDSAESPVTEIIRLYYEKSLHSISQTDKPLAIEIMQLLVLNENTRNIYHRDAIEAVLIGSYSSERIAAMLSKLEHETRLIRSERRAGGQYYEINSESLIPYINRLKREKEQSQLRLIRERKTKRRLITIGIFLALLIAATAFVLQNRIAKDNYAETYILAARNAWNPTLSYAIAKSAFKDDAAPKSMRQYLQKLESKPGFFRTSSLYLNTEIHKAFFKGSDTIGVIEERAILYYNKKGLLLDEWRLDDASSILLANPEAGYLILDNKDNSYTFQKFDGNAKFKVKAKMSDKRSAIAPDGNTFVLMGTIWKAGNPAPAGYITEEVDQVLFTHDSRHIIARSGFNIYRYSITGEKEKFDFNTPLVEAHDISISYDDRFFIMTDIFRNHPEFIPVADSRKIATGHGREDSSERDPNGNGNRTGSNNASAEPITAVIPSPENQIVIGIKGEEANIWNFEGSKIGSLKSDDPLAGLAFSKDGQEVVTWTASGKVFAWKKGNLDKLHQSGQLVFFSPFEFAKAGLWTFTAKEAYGYGRNKQVEEYPEEILARVLNYAGSLPRSNDRPDDEDYTALLRRSVKEVSGMYRKVLHPAMFKKLSKLNKKQLCLNYANFKTDSLYLAGNSENPKVRMAAYLEGLRWKFKAAQYDKHDNETLFDLVDSYQNLAYSYIPAYQKSATTTEEAIRLLQRIKATEASTKLLAECYGSLSYYRLFVKDFKGAIAASKEGLRLDPKQEWIYTNLALGLLLDGQKTAAQKVYTEHRNLSISFVEDINELMEAGVISQKSHYYNDVLGIKRMFGT